VPARSTSAWLGPAAGFAHGVQIAGKDIGASFRGPGCGLGTARQRPRSGHRASPGYISVAMPLPQSHSDPRRHSGLLPDVPQLTRSVTLRLPGTAASPAHEKAGLAAAGVLALAGDGSPFR